MPERWILSRLQSACAEVDASLEAFQFSKAANAIFHFIYDDLCDWYIELAKPNLYQGPELEQDHAKATRRHVVQGVLATVLETTLRLLHPFAPYVTEEIWQKLPKPPQLPGSLMITVFPRSDDSWIDPGAEAEMQLVQDVAVACRMLRATYNVPPTQKIEVELRVTTDATRAIVEQHLAMIERSAKISAKVASAAGTAQQGAAKAMVGADVEIVMPLGGLIDVTAEKGRITKDVAKADKEITTIERKLENPEFIAKANPEVVETLRARLVDEQQRRQRLVDALETLGASA
jgi:valyl-tRNA synthetase